jgi:polyisoprenoid-binding protein YceI
MSRGIGFLGRFGRARRFGSSLLLYGPARPVPPTSRVLSAAGADQAPPRSGRKSTAGRNPSRAFAGSEHLDGRESEAHRVAGSAASGLALLEGGRQGVNKSSTTPRGRGSGISPSPHVSLPSSHLLARAPRSIYNSFTPSLQPVRVTLLGESARLRRGHMRRVLALWAAGLAWTAAASAQQRAIDLDKSVMTVEVHRAGIFSPLGHNHEIAAPIARGTVDSAARRIEVYTNAAALRVRDPDISDKDRAQIQSTMLGPEVLDAQRYSEIVFRSTAAEPAGPGSWKVYGNLTLHGQIHPVAVEVREAGGHYLGTSRFKQTDFGITPVKVAGGAVRVKDEVRIEFDIQLVR